MISIFFNSLFYVLGEQGDSFDGIRGLPGDKGIRGPPGIRGLNGLPGPQGIRCVIQNYAFYFIYFVFIYLFQLYLYKKTAIPRYFKQLRLHKQLKTHLIRNWFKTTCRFFYQKFGILIFSFFTHFRGEYGFKGQVGNPGWSFRGPKGEIGDRGLSGLDGRDGLFGLPGDKVYLIFFFVKLL